MHFLVRPLRSLALACGLAFLPANPGVGAAPSEYEVKAAFLVNFVSYVQWPEGQPKPRNFTVCVHGRDPFGAILDEAFGNRRVHDRDVRVLRFQEASQLLGCNLVFIGGSDPVRLRSVLDALGRSPVLTVADSAGFAERGVMINLRVEHNKVRFDINPDAAERAGLKLSSQLLKLANLVGRGAGAER